jgi:hypothetical protein
MDVDYVFAVAFARLRELTSLRAVRARGKAEYHIYDGEVRSLRLGFSPDDHAVAAETDIEFRFGLGEGAADYNSIASVVFADDQAAHPVRADLRGGRFVLGLSAGTKGDGQSDDGQNQSCGEFQVFRFH